jgi:hypothetical protein
MTSCTTHLSNGDIRVFLGNSSEIYGLLTLTEAEPHFAHEECVMLNFKPIADEELESCPAW